MHKKFLNLIFGLCLSTTSCFAADIWVDAVNGNDSFDGLSINTAFRTLQAAAHVAMPGTTVHIQPGIYRETIKPTNSGTVQAPILYLAAQGPGTVTVRGSELITNWTALTENTIGLPANVEPNQIVWADLSSWELTQVPRFVMDASENVMQRLTLAREPDWQIQTDWKSHEFWWTADGGATVAACEPVTDKKPASCDQASRSFNQLLDQNDDPASMEIESGNLTSLGDLTGATLVAMDTFQGDYVFHRTIKTHDVNAGQITIEPDTIRDSANNPEGLGWGSKYYLENHPALLESPGEYWFDVTTGYLYLWPLNAQSPTLEIAKREIGWDLTNLSYLTLDGLKLELFNDKAITIQNRAHQHSYGNQGQNLQIRYAKQGLFVEQVVTAASSPANMIKELGLENSEISDIDSEGIYLGSQWENDSDPALFSHAPITNTLIKNNKLHHLGFRAQRDESAGLELRFADNLRFEDNHVHHVAHYGILFAQSVIQAEKTFGFAPSDIKTGDILIKNNVIEHTCQLVSECGGLVFRGIAPQQHVFRNVLVIKNTFRENYGWSYVAEQRRRWAKGYFGFGLFLQDASGIHAYRNLAYNNSWAGFFLFNHWRDGEIILANNLLANGSRGINIFNSKELDTQASIDTQIVNNLIINNEKYGIEHAPPTGEGQFILDYNLYYANGWGNKANAGAMKVVRGDAYERFADIQVNTAWETDGISEPPAFFSYDYGAQRERGHTSVLDFDLKRESAALEQGSAMLPSSLQSLLSQFKIQDMQKQGTVWDIGPFEYSENHQPVISQGTAMEIPSLQTHTTTAQFSGFVTTGLVGSSLGQRGNGLTFSQADRLKVVAEIKVDSNDVGQSAELVVVAAYTPPNREAISYFMSQDTEWVSWNGDLTTLAAAEIVPNLPKQFELFDNPFIEITIHEGYLPNLPGHFTIYVGYLINKKLVVFNGQNPLQFFVNTET